MSLRNDAKNQEQPQGSQPNASINTDLTADYLAGQQLADAKLQAFHKGFSDRMSQAQQFLNNEFNAGSFAIASANYTRALPSSETVNASFQALLYGGSTVEVPNE